MTQPPVHIARVSLRPQVEASSGRKEIKYDLELARRLGIGTVQLEPGGLLVPATLSVRLTVTKQDITPGITTDRWEFLVSPATETTLKRLFAKRMNRTVMGVLDVPAPKFVPNAGGDLDVRYDAGDRLKKGCAELSKLAPPRAGTFVEMMGVVTKDGVRGVLPIRGSSTSRLVHEWAMWEANNWPFARIKKYLAQRGYSSDLTMPTEPIPEVDPWAQGGEHWDRLITIVDVHFGELLQSLWRATYAQSPFVVGQLEKCGYDFNRIEQTHLGLDPLADLISGLREGSEHLTMMAAPDLLDLKPVDLAELARRGKHTTKSPVVEIDDPEDFEDE